MLVATKQQYMAKENFEIYRGAKVKYSGNRIDIRLDNKSYKKIIDVVAETGLSKADVVILLMSPCQECNNNSIVIEKPKIKK